MDFFELLRYSINDQAEVPKDSETDWETLLELAKKQTLLGVIYHGFARLPLEQRPPKKILLKWYMMAEKLKKRNETLNAIAAQFTVLLDGAQIGNCILKGQGNAMMYADPFSRMPGDIDIWIDPKQTVVRDGKLCIGDHQLHVKKRSYRHIEIGKYKEVEIEIHTRPSFMNNLIHNYRLQKWFDKEAQSQFANHIDLPQGAGRINVPTTDFNVIYQLCHITNHFFYEGIGLRQFVDYYYVLQRAKDIDRDKIGRLLKRFGLYKMAGAVMYIEKELLGLDEEYLIAPVNQKAGELLYREIMLSGNFGKYDERRKGATSKVAKNMKRTERDLRLLSVFPSECLWEPVFRGYHFMWRVFNGDI
jgi:hypothetical protein